MRRTWKIVASACAGIGVLVVGGPFVYIHFIEGKAPAPLRLSATATTTGPAATTSSPSGAGPSGAGAGIDGTWSVASGSQAGYRIKETLFGQSNTAVGRTTAVTGSISISGTDVTAGSLTVDMTQVTSDQSQRDGQFRRRIMETSTYPTARFALTKPIALGSVPADGVQVTENATGDLTLHGITRSVTFPVTARHSGSGIRVSGSVPITFADWNISNPSGGPASTEDHGTLEFLVDFAHG